MSILLGATCIVGILFMATFMFIGIWLFIVALKSFQQMRYRNYILEKIYEKLDAISVNTSTYQKDPQDDSSLNPLDLEGEENISDFENLKNIK